MTLDAEESAVLLELHARTLEFRNLPPVKPWQWWEQSERDDLAANGMRYAANDWFGPGLLERERVRYLRAIQRLAAVGLLTIVKTGPRMTHLRITDEGEKAAKELASV
jgi:hypothetical protein